MSIRSTALLKPYGKTIDDAVRHYIGYLEQSGKTITIADLVEEFQRIKKAEGARPRYLDSLRFHLKRFSQDLGTRLSSDITAKEIQAWLLNLKQSPVSTNTFREKIGTLFSHALLHDYVTINPVIKVKKLKVPSRKVQVYKPEELELILKNTPFELIPIITIQAFAGLRPSEVESLTWEDVDLHGHGMIEVNAKKVNKRRYVPIEDNLKLWLAPYAGKTGRLLNELLNLPYHQFVTIMEKAGVTLHPDGFRHSYATYHLAQHRNRAVLAEYMGNSPDIIKRHYDARALPKDAEKYWSIKPNQL